jgi:hypothetical protein
MEEMKQKDRSWVDSLKGRDHLEDLGVDRRIIFN